MADDGQKAPCSCLVALQSTHEEKSQRGNTHRGNGESPAQVDVAYREDWGWPDAEGSDLPNANDEGIIATEVGCGLGARAY
eukprot:scaffold1751_cov108-Skeletonema_marinoi.AAC.1